MYKSSRSTFAIKYIFPFIGLGFTGFVIYMFWMEAGGEFTGIIKAMIAGIGWSSIFTLTSLVRLKNVEATNTGIIIRDAGDVTEVAYRNIHWISRYDILSSGFTTIKYHEINTGMDKKITFLPRQNFRQTDTEDAMSKYIRRNVMSKNPNYLIENEPSKLKSRLFGFLLSLPVLVIAIYFMKGSIKFF